MPDAPRHELMRRSSSCMEPDRGGRLTTSADQDRVKLREGAVAWQEVEGETILLDLASSTYLGVNASGTLLWSALAEGTSRAAMVERLTSSFDVSAEQAAIDVDAFLLDCRGRNLLET